MVLFLQRWAGCCLLREVPMVRTKGMPSFSLSILTFFKATILLDSLSRALSDSNVSLQRILLCFYAGFGCI